MKKQKKTIAELEGVPAARVPAPEPRTQRAQPTAQAKPASALDGLDNATINRAIDLAGELGMRADDLARRCGITVEAAHAVLEYSRHAAAKHRARNRGHLLPPAPEQDLAGLPKHSSFLDKWWGPR
jgi:hypothetical protein